MGRDDQRIDDIVGRMGQITHRPDCAHDGNFRLHFMACLLLKDRLWRSSRLTPLSHYTDWTIGHVHSGALGWNGMISFAAIYYLVPKLWNREQLYSLRLVNWHVWLATLGIVIYAAVMWVAGITQGLMWREYDDQGYLVNSFVETVSAIHPEYVMRIFGGLLYLGGALLMAYNVYRTIRGDVRKEAPMGASIAATSPAE